MASLNGVLAASFFLAGQINGSLRPSFGHAVPSEPSQLFKVDIHYLELHHIQKDITFISCRDMIVDNNQKYTRQTESEQQTTG